MPKPTVLVTAIGGVVPALQRVLAYNPPANCRLRTLAELYVELGRSHSVFV